jgi:nicotinamidase/pyrazinamidase
MKPKKALLVVDLQNDFCPNGALGVSAGDKIIPKINKYIKFFSGAKLAVFLSRDWHPKKTGHFKQFGGVWPVHCVKGTKGSRFGPGLKIPKEAILLYKGMDPQKDSYSVFQAEDKRGIGFSKILKTLGIREIYIAGLATDYCVKFSALDALKKGFSVKILTDAIKGVDLKPGDSQRALKEAAKKGAKFFVFSRLLK